MIYFSRPEIAASSSVNSYQVLDTELARYFENIFSNPYGNVQGSYYSLLVRGENWGTEKWSNLTKIT